MKADSAPVQDTEGDGRSRRSPRDWWCLGWAWVVVAFIEIGGALRYGSGLQLVTGTATLVLAALWVFISLTRGAGHGGPIDEVLGMPTTRAFVIREPPQNDALTWRNRKPRSPAEWRRAAITDNCSSSTRGFGRQPHLGRRVTALPTSADGARSATRASSSSRRRPCTTRSGRPRPRPGVNVISEEHAFAGDEVCMPDQGGDGEALGGASFHPETAGYRWEASDIAGVVG